MYFANFCRSRSSATDRGNQSPQRNESPSVSHGEAGHRQSGCHQQLRQWPLHHQHGNRRFGGNQHPQVGQSGNQSAGPLSCTPSAVPHSSSSCTINLPHDLKMSFQNFNFVYKQT
uniref:(northern house mosquito) hypothetical protein n=1 Tax=Culex pipiens TaxID=7175 RepID=A0A8D8H8A6_CULPI